MWEDVWLEHLEKRIIGDLLLHHRVASASCDMSVHTDLAKSGLTVLCHTLCTVKMKCYVTVFLFLKFKFALHSRIFDDDSKIQEQSQTTLAKFKIQDLCRCFQPWYQVAEEWLWRRLFGIVNIIIDRNKCSPDIIWSFHIATQS